ncbi:MAG: rhodanese-related sulfurtransferase [Verrucomicrobiota bacterium]
MFYWSPVLIQYEVVNFKIAAFYQFVELADYVEWAEKIRCFGAETGLKGTIILAAEGMNGTVAAAPSVIDQFLGLLKADPRFEQLEHKVSWNEEQPFPRLRVREKKEIVTFRQFDIDPTNPGTYVEPEKWNELITGSDVITVDTRNTYETKIGKFKGAIDPQTANFTEFAQYVDENLDPAEHPKVAMYCTGGIRCEKATAFLKSKGFKDVYHLKGGILKYLEEIPKEKSQWEGECFVFDRRVAVDHDLQASDWQICEKCNEPFKKGEVCSECGSSEYVF